MAGNVDEQFEDSHSNAQFIYEAKHAVRLPATLLILVGLLGVISAIVGLIELPSLPPKLDAMIATIDADPNLPREEKDNWIDILSAVKESAEQPTALISYIIELICCALVMFGGIRMMQLSGPAFPTVASVLAMIPCTVGCCCILGLPAGILSLMVLHRPSVRAAMSARNSTFSGRDEHMGG